MRFVPLKELQEIAFSHHKNHVLFKVDPLKNLHPYEVLEYIPSSAVVVTLNKTAKNLCEQLKQHGWKTDHVRFIDTLAKRINSPFEIKNAVYLPRVDLAELAEEVQRQVASLPFGTKFLFFDGVHDLVQYAGEEKIVRFVDFLAKRAGVLNMKVIFLANPRRLTKNISRELFVNCQKVFEVPS